MATNICFIISRKKISCKPCGHSHKADLHHVSKRGNKCQTLFVARALPSHAGCEFYDMLDMCICEHTDCCKSVSQRRFDVVCYSSCPPLSPRWRQAWRRCGCVVSTEEWQSICAAELVLMGLGVSRPLQWHAVVQTWLSIWPGKRWQARALLVSTGTYRQWLSTKLANVSVSVLARCRHGGRWAPTRRQCKPHRFVVFSAWPCRALAAAAAALAECLKEYTSGH